MTLLTFEISPLSPAVVRVVAACLSSPLLASCTPAAKGARALDRADRYFKAGEYDKARIEYLNVLQLDRANRTAIKQLGIIWFEEGAPLRAYPFLRATRELDPNNLSNRTKLATVFLMIGEAEAARKEALAILKQSPSEGEALLVLADSAGSKQAAEETEQQLQQIKPSESSS